MAELDFDVQSIKRSGVKKIIDLAQTACRLVNASAAIIKKAYPASPKLHLLLDGIAAICPLIGDARIEMDQIEGDFPDEVDGTQWPGVNLLAAPYVEPAP